MTAHDPAARADTGPDGDLPSGPYSAQRSGADLDQGGLPPELATAASALFGGRLPLAISYAHLLATDGVVRGLIGPREAPRIWDRHLLNCAALAELIPADSTVLDVGSGAGLPGLVLAIARPDLRVGLIEPMARRTAFLTEVIDRLDLAPVVTVLRGRAEEIAVGTGDAGTVGGGKLDGANMMADVVTARAVAPLDRLAGWCLPLVRPGGRLLAMKGASAGEEVTEHRDALGRLGGGEPAVLHCGMGLLDPPTTVVAVIRERMVNPGQPLRQSKTKRPNRASSGSGPRRSGGFRRN